MPFRMAFGALLMLITLLAGIGLLGVSGWFITGSALAGLGSLEPPASTSPPPSAAIRACSVVSRTACRDAERLVNDEATFRLLADLRRWLFSKAIPLDVVKVARLTGGDLLTCLTAHIDALDNLYLRVVAPSIVAHRNCRRRPGAAWMDRSPRGAGDGGPDAGRRNPARPCGQPRRRAGGDMVAIASRLRTRAVDGIQGLADLRAFGGKGPAAGGYFQRNR